MSHTGIKTMKTLTKIFNKMFAVILASTLVLLPFTAFASTSGKAKSIDTDLGAVQGYNLVVLGDFTNGSTDIEGKSAIAGKITVNGGFTFGNGNSNRPIKSGYGLVWGGTDHHDFNVSSGYTNATAFVNQATLNAFTGYNQFKFSNYETWSDESQFKQKCGFTFPELQAQLIKTSEQISDLSANGTCVINPYGDPQELQFNGDDQKINVFTISAQTLANYPRIRLNTPDSSTDVINVIGKNVTLPLVNGKNGSNLDGQNGGSGAYKLTHLLWNLSSAATVSNWSWQSIKGSVLAPNAEFTPVSGGNFEGTFVVASFHTTNSFEGHNYPFSGIIPIEQDPDSSENSSTASSENSSTVSSENSSMASSENSSTVSSENSSTVSSENSSTVSSENSSTVSSENSSTVSSENSSTASSENSSTVSSENSSTASSENSNTASSENSSTASSENSSVASSENSSTVSSENSSTANSENSSTISSSMSSSSSGGTHSGNPGQTTGSTPGSGSSSSSGVEVIGEESTPLAGPSAASSAVSLSSGEAISDGKVPLAAPKTGESKAVAGALSVAAVISMILVIALRGKRSQGENS
jgi:choice-of-anchor A domain-containing protein